MTKSFFEREMAKERKKLYASPKKKKDRPIKVNHTINLKISK